MTPSPSLSATVEPTAVAEVTIAPEVGQRLQAILSTYTDLELQADVLKEQMDAEKAKMFAILEENGLKKVVIDNRPVSIVRSSSSSLDKVKFVELGGSLKTLESATVSKPKKPYLQIGEEKKVA